MQNTTVVITGASSGIGEATVRAFAAQGANVVLVARSEDKLNHIAASLPGDPLVLPTDLSNPDQAHAMVTRVMTEREQLDILVNNAGVGVSGPVATLNHADIAHVMAVNFFGPLATIQAALPVMQRQGHGHIINVSSTVGQMSLPYIGGYAASKAALDRLTESLRMETLGSNIAVTLVRPGTTNTGFSTRRLGKGHERRRMVPSGASPEQVAQTIVRAAVKRPRVAYVTLRDRIQIGIAMLAPALVERTLSKLFSWEDQPNAQREDQ